MPVPYSSSPSRLSRSIRLALLPLCASLPLQALAQDSAVEIEVVGVVPGGALDQPIERVPFAVKRIGYDDLENSQAPDITDYLNNQVGSVSINSAQNNPLQPDVQIRGFTSSPLLGLAQGVAVYQNGVRINEPLGDAVNWDLLPESAVYGMDLISGANPLFGLNTQGGAVAVRMKDGFLYQDTQLEALGGSWGRRSLMAESGGSHALGGDSELAYYVNLSHFEEDGWRDLSDSDADSFYGNIGWRRGDTSSLLASWQSSESDLTGNGALPVGQLAVDRSSIFTAPDITENDMQMFTLEGSHLLGSGITLSANAFWRENETDSFNGDGSEFELCEYAGGGMSLFEEADDIEDALEDELGVELDDICEGGDPAITSYDELEDYIEDQAVLAGLDPEDFELEDVIDDLSGTGVLSDEAINNISRREQTSQGFGAELAFGEDFFGSDNQLVIGASWFEGEATFESVVELAELDPVTRSTQGLGTGTFFDEGETDVRTATETLSLYFLDTWQLSDTFALIVGGRWNDTDIQLRDRSGERPELNGDHNFSRFNPSVGFTWDPTETLNVYGSLSESNRVPTPIELACNEGVFELARQYAIADGEDPDDIEFECRLPNAFLADPPLDDVVTRSLEFGVRGENDNISYQIGVFDAHNRDDILFQTTGRSTGLFANVDETRRRGLEVALQGTAGRVDWAASYTWLEATFQDDFMVLSPNHPNADEEGELAVQNGDRIPGLPEHLIKVGGDYHITRSFSLGAEMLWNSSQVMRGDESNDLDEVDGYALVNLRAGLTVNDNFTLFARVTNVFDTEYENFGLLGEDPTEILEDLDDSSPVFLGVGAPRAGWLGLRYSF